MHGEFSVTEPCAQKGPIKSVQQIIFTHPRQGFAQNWVYSIAYTFGKPFRMSLSPCYLIPNVRVVEQLLHSSSSSYCLTSAQATVGYIGVPESKRTGEGSILLPLFMIPLCSVTPPSVRRGPIRSAYRIE